MFCKKCVLIIRQNLKKKHLCQSLYFNEVGGLQLCLKRLRHSCFPVTFVQLLRTSITQNISMRYRLRPAPVSLFMPCHEKHDLCMNRVLLDRVSWNGPTLLSVEAVAQRCSVRKVFLEISQNSEENTCARQKRHSGTGVFLRPATLSKKRLWHGCSPVNFVKFLRAPFLTEHLWWLLL